MVVNKFTRLLLCAMVASNLISPTPATAAAVLDQTTLIICTSLKTGYQLISKTGKCNERIYEARTWFQKGSAPSGTAGSIALDLATCISKRSALQTLLTRSACNSKTQTTSLWQRPLGPSVAPSITSVVMGLLGTATLNIAAPAEDGGARITSYLVTSSPAAVAATFTPAQIKAAKITGLTPGSTYSFSVVAINSKGSSPSSIASAPALAPTIPNVPGITKVVATGTNSAQLTYTAPLDNGGSSVTSYVATSLPGGLQTTVYQSADGTINITNLSHSTTYTFTLMAINAAGSSLASAISASVTTATPPPPPEPVAAAPSAPTDTVISVAAIAGVTAPVTGATPVSTTNAGSGYTGTVSWSGTPTTFAGVTTYTATITLTPASGYTLTGVTANFFTVAGATTNTNPANSGVITAVFPATSTTISAPAIAGVTVPDTGATPVSTTTAGTGYTGTVSWSGSPATFAAGTAYTATITLTPTSGYTLAGVSANFFTVAGATTVTNSANAGVITAVFPATADTVINIAGILGVTAPVTGATPVTAITESAQYTGTVTWASSGGALVGNFVSGTIYTATITLTAKSGFTLTGVGTNFFTVAGTSSDTNIASSGVVTAVFPVTASKVAITRASVGTQRRTAFTTQPQITVQDSGGSTVISSSAVVTATVSAGGTLVGTTTATASSGVASFTGLGVDGTIGTTYTITYTASGLTVATATVTLTGTTCDGSTFTCQVGDTGPGGGIVYYVSAEYFTSTGSTCNATCKYLEAAPTTGTKAWTNATYGWSGNTSTAIGTTAQGTAIGTGYANTLAIVGQDSTALRAGTISWAYEGPNNSTDWFLPSKDELNQLYIQRVSVGVGVGFLYWSSSESNANNAWLQENGVQNYWRKSASTIYVRPVRAF